MTTGVLPAANQLYQNFRPQYFPGSTVATLNPMQEAGIQSLIGAGNQMAGYVPGMMGTGGDAMNAMLNFARGGGAQVGGEFTNMLGPEYFNAIQGNFEVNPFVEDQARAFSQAAERGIRENIIPTTSLNALMAGQMGSSRHGIAQGLATARLGETLQEQLANLHLNAWQNAAANQLASRGQTLQALGQERGRGTQAAIANAQNETAAWGMLPGMMNAYGNMANTAAGLSRLPGLAQLQGGQMYRNVAQNQLNEAQNRWNFYQNAPWDNLARYASIVHGTPYASPRAPTPINPMAAGALGVQTGLNIWDMLNPAGGGFAPMGAGSSLGAGVGGFPASFI